MKKQMKRVVAYVMAFLIEVTKVMFDLPTTTYAAFITTETLEDFEDASAVKSWKTEGDSPKLSAETGQSDSTALAVNYKMGSQGYVGATRSLSKVDLSQYKGISLWLKQDGSGNTFKIQIKYCLPNKTSLVSPGTRTSHLRPVTHHGAFLFAFVITQAVPQSRHLPPPSPTVSPVPRSVMSNLGLIC